jgi:hypothetical protein
LCTVSTTCTLHRVLCVSCVSSLCLSLFDATMSLCACICHVRCICACASDLACSLAPQLPIGVETAKQLGMGTRFYGYVQCVMCVTCARVCVLHVPVTLHVRHLLSARTGPTCSISLKTAPSTGSTRTSTTSFCSACFYFQNVRKTHCACVQCEWLCWRVA